MAGNGAATAYRRILPNRVISAFAYKLTPVFTQMSKEVASSHSSGACGTTLTRDDAVKSR